MKRKEHIAALKAAFPHTLPIMTGFLFLGFAYGVFMRTSGFNALYPLITSSFIFAGSAEFMAVNLMLGTFDPVEAFFVILILNARHIFYGLSMLEKYKELGAKKLYMIFALCDETFSVNCTAEPPKGVDRGLFMFFITLLNQLYWICGSTLGGLAGSLVGFEIKGLDFVMTAMFVVIFLEQLIKARSKLPALSGLLLSALCLVIFGADSFVIPSMLLIVAALAFLKTPIRKEIEGRNDK